MSSFKIFVSGGNNLPSGLLDIINQNKGKPIAISQPSAAASAGPNGASVAEPTSSAMVFPNLNNIIIIKLRWNLCDEFQGPPANGAGF